MIRRVANSLSKVLLETNNIKQEEYDIYRYLLEYILENMVFFLFHVVCGMLFGDVVYGLLLFAVIFPLRSFGGGVHAPTKRMCGVLSYGMVICVTGLIPVATNVVPSLIWTIVMCTSSIGIICFAPVDCPNKRLTEEQKEGLRKKCLVSLMIISMTYTALLDFHMMKYCGIISTGTMIVAVSEVLGGMV